MADVVTLPAAGVAEVREALLCALGEQVEAIGHSLTLPEHELHPEWFEGARRRFEEVCRLLDTIGWDAAAAPRTVEVTREDAQTICGAVEDYLPLVEQWLCEAGALRRRREHRDSVRAMWSLLAVLRGAAGEQEQAA